MICLKQGNEINNFYLKQGQGLKGSRAHVYPINLAILQDNLK